jgi:hypothetical protein
MSRKGVKNRRVLLELTICNPVIHNRALHPSLIRHLLRQLQHRHHGQTDVVLRSRVMVIGRNSRRERSRQRAGRDGDRGSSAGTVASDEPEKDLEDVIRIGEEVVVLKLAAVSGGADGGVHRPRVKDGGDGWGLDLREGEVVRGEGGGKLA